MAFSDWSTVAANNGAMPGIIWSEGMLPSQINNSARQMMADLAILKGNGGAALIGTSGGISVEAEFALQQTAISLIAGTLTSGRLGYTTYALLAANVTAAVGTLAEVPITDVGTHTDPVVGGVVNNTGIFKWSASPAGWLRMYDTDAASGKPYATAAAASAAAALVSQGLCAGYAAGMAVAIRDSALHDYRRTGFIRTTDTAGLVAQADGTYQVPAGVGCAWYVYNLPLTWAADRDAARATNFSIDIVSGVLDGTCQLEQYTAVNQGGAMVAVTAFDAVTDGKAKTITLDPTCKSIRAIIGSTAGAYVHVLGGASNYPARAPTDPDFIAAQGAAAAALGDAPIPITITDIVLAAVSGAVTYDYTTLKVPANGSAQVKFACKGAFVDGDFGVFTFTSDLPLGTINQGITSVYDANGGHAQSGAIPNPGVVSYGKGVYAVPFQVQSPGGQAWFGLQMNVNSPAGSATRNVTNFQLWKGIHTPPPLQRVPAMLQDYIAKQARYEADARDIARFPIACYGDSETQFNGDQKNWPQWLQTLVIDRAEIHPRGVPGDVADDILLRAGYKPCIVTGVAGGVIPAACIPVALSGWNIRPGSSFSIVSIFVKANPDVLPYVYLNNVLGRIWCDTFDAANPPQPVVGSLFFQRLVAGAAQAVPNGSKLIWQDGVVTQRRRHIVMGTYNTASLTRTTADTMFAKKLALDGNYKNLLYIPYGVALGTGSANPYYTAMAAAYPGQVLDINYAPTTTEQTMITALFGIVFTDPTTILEMSQGYVPSVLKQAGDGTHWNTAGHYLIATRIYTWVSANWITP